MAISNFVVNTANPNTVMVGRPFTVTFDVDNSETSKLTGVRLRLAFGRNVVVEQLPTWQYALVTGLSVSKGGRATVTAECLIPNEVIDYMTSQDYGHSRTGVYTRVSYLYADNTETMATSAVLLPSNVGLTVIQSSYEPSIVLDAERYNSNTQEPSDEGETVVIRYTLNAAEGHYDGFALTGTISDAAGSINITGLPKPDANVEQVFTLQGSYDKGTAWTVTLTLNDGAEIVSVSETVDRAFANLHLSGKPVGGVCVGGFSSVSDTDRTGKFECYFPAYFYGGVYGAGAGDYSTDEQDTGSKWIDGKTIYRKTFVKTALKGVSSAANADIASISDIGIETVIEMRGIVVLSSGSTHPVPGWYSSDNFRHPYISTDGTYLRMRHNEGSTSPTMTVYITMYYTKT